MPGGDRRGPEGKGPMTGRGLGLCSGEEVPGYRSEVSKIGPGTGRGNGRRFGQSDSYNPRGERRPRDGRGRGYRD